MNPKFCAVASSLLPNASKGLKVHNSLIFKFSTNNLFRALSLNNTNISTLHYYCFNTTYLTFQKIIAVMTLQLEHLLAYNIIAKHNVFDPPWCGSYEIYEPPN